MSKDRGAMVCLRDSLLSDMTRFREIIQNEVGKVGLDLRVELEMGEGRIGFLCKEKLIFES